MREPTVSVTSLVKQIASEEFERRMNSHMNAIYEHIKVVEGKILSEIAIEVSKARKTEIVAENCRSMAKSMEKEFFPTNYQPTRFMGLGVKPPMPDVSMAGKKWTEDEEAQLREEMDAAIQKIAAEHRRYPSGIRSRMAKCGIATFDYHDPRNGD